MPRSLSIPIVECHGGPLDGYICRWPVQDGSPVPAIELEYAAYTEDPEQAEELIVPDHRRAVYAYVDRRRAVFRPRHG